MGLKVLGIFCVILNTLSAFICTIVAIAQFLNDDIFRGAIMLLLVVSNITCLVINVRNIRNLKWKGRKKSVTG